MKVFVRCAASSSSSRWPPLPLIADSKIVYRWVLTGMPMPKIKKILVIAAVENYLIRQEFEDQMEKLLAKSGVESVPSYTFLRRATK